MESSEKAYIAQKNQEIEIERFQKEQLKAQTLLAQTEKHARLAFAPGKELDTKLEKLYRYSNEIKHAENIDTLTHILHKVNDYIASYSISEKDDSKTLSATAS